MDKDRMLMVLLDCTGDELAFLDKIGYDVAETVAGLMGKGIRPTYRDVVQETFSRSIAELQSGIESDLTALAEKLGSDPDREHREILSGDIRELRRLNPVRDIRLAFGPDGPECRIIRNGDIYRGYDGLMRVLWRTGFRLRQGS